MEERRRYVRLPISLTVGYKVLESQERLAFALTGDISAGGLSLFLPKRLDIGTKLELEIKLLHRRTFRALGEVINQQEIPTFDEKSGIYLKTGIRFIQIDEKDREKIADFVSEQIIGKR